MSDWILPHRPDNIDFGAYSALTANPVCDRLIKGECDRPCHPAMTLDIDHIEPISKGGSDALSNLRLVCSNYNRYTKNDRLDPYYLEPSYFDQEINVERLRASQRDYAYNLVTGTYRTVFEESPAYLFKKYMLIAAVVGAGKTLMMVAICCAINKVINGKGVGRKRIKRVLWLVHQKDLVKSLKTELAGHGQIKSEIVAHSLLSTAPRVGAVDEYGDWMTYRNCDIVAATPQSLWEVSGKSRGLTISDKRDILGRFDLIVVDECHYAMDQYLAILEQAPTALKFVMSATPMNADGEFFSQMDGGKYADIFRLFSAYGYEEGFQDGILKRLPSFSSGKGVNYIEMAGGESTYLESGQVINGETNSMERLNVNRVKALICKGVEIASRNTDYDAHVMIRTGSIAQCKATAELANAAIAELKPSGNGWGAFPVHTGSKEKLGNVDNPWLTAKRNKGRCTSKSKRIVVAADLGQFGVNQPYCNTIVYVEPNLSQIEIVQRLGRAIRRSPQMRSLADDERVYVVWDAKHAGFAEKLSEAISYLNDMRNKVTEAFIPLQLVDEDKEVKVFPAPARQPLEAGERIAIAELLGRKIVESSGCSDEEIVAIAEAVYDVGAERKLSDVRKFVNEISVQCDSYRNNQFCLPHSLQPLRIVLREKPQLTFSEEELICFVKDNPTIYPIPSGFINGIREKADWVVEAVTAQARKHREIFHSPPSSFVEPRQILGVCQEKKEGKVNVDGNYKSKILKDINTAIKLLVAQGLIEWTKDDAIALGGVANQALQAAVSKVLELPNFQEKTILDYKAQISDALCSPMVESVVKKIASASILDKYKHVFSGTNAIYSEQIGAIVKYMKGDQYGEAQAENI